ncbi:uncharacterized protein [Coffea arabica]|uniref:Reverse transcriptase Ty1/copia-type domain-containing protein n=1 Tax=Coffea arabica TaxID=13443 RepID=A0ABM4UAG3_COFAR
MGSASMVDESLCGFYVHGCLPANDLTNITININNISMLNGTNFKFWKENLLIVLGIMDLNLALRDDSPPPLTDQSTSDEKRNNERYSERSRGYKFYDPTTKSIFEAGNARFFEDIEFGGENTVRDIVFKEQYINIPTGVITLAQNPIPELDHDMTNHDNVEEQTVIEEQILPFQEPAPLRRSTRARRSTVSNDYIIFLQEHEDDSGLMEDDPINFRQVMEISNSQKWIDAMNEEIKSMKDNDVWDLVLLPEGAKPIGCKWIFKIERNLKDNVERYKTHLVVKEFTQKEGIDYKETFSPISSKDSFRIIMALVAHFDLELHQMDVKTAFLNGNIDEIIYMVQPENFVSGDPKNMVCKLKKSIYGLKQASRQ